MITARDIAPPARPAAAPTAMPLPAAVQSGWERILRGTLFVTILLSCVAFIEPSPHDGMMVVLVLVTFFAGVTLPRFIAPLLLLLLVWSVGGLLSLTNVPDNARAITYVAISIYLAVAALLFASIVADNTMQRMAAIRSAYVAAAVITAIAGMVGYFNLIPKLYEVLTLYGRATGFFKDPNVYGPFLIWPSLIIGARMLTEQLRLRDTILQFIIVAGIMLSFSRGAWMHFLLSGFVMIVLLFLTAPALPFRIRIVGFTGVGAVVLIILFVVMISIPQVRDLLAERANIVNPYDVGEGGRFTLQEIAVGTVLQFPNGLGPHEFARIYGLQQHNVYLQAFIVYGWLGGTTYLLLLATTIFVGLRNALTAAPWQIYAIVTFAVFIGEVGESIIIDSDHWRHFFLIMGLVWGLAAATRNHRRSTYTQQAVPA